MNDSDGVQCKARKERSEGGIETGKKPSRHSICGISPIFFVFFALLSWPTSVFGFSFSHATQTHPHWWIRRNHAADRGSGHRVPSKKRRAAHGGAGGRRKIL